MDSEDQIRMAFHNVKKDIMELKSQLLMVAERQEKLEVSMEESKSGSLVQIKSTPAKAKKPAKKKAAKKKK